MNWKRDILCWMEIHTGKWGPVQKHTRKRQAGPNDAKEDWEQQYQERLCAHCNKLQVLERQERLVSRTMPWSDRYNDSDK